MFNNGSLQGGAEKGFYYLERILDLLIRLFNALTGNSSKPAAPVPGEADQTPIDG